MDNLLIYNRPKIQSLFSPRAGEQKLGDTIINVHSMDEIRASSARFVLIGIPEDIGVRANLGIAGASSLWKGFLSAFLGVQDNKLLRGEQIILLGEIVPPDALNSEISALRHEVTKLDDMVSAVVQAIVEMGKTPLIIGGGHNNAYPIIKGLSLATKKSVNTINIDAHADLRDPSEGRHSGNGFSKAMLDGYLNYYGIFGLHQNYNNGAIVEFIENHDRINAVFFDDLLLSDDNIISSWELFRSTMPEKCGLEIDLDAISNTLSSASTPSGFTLNNIRRIILRGEYSYSYLHICEGATKLADGREDKMISKAVTYLLTDFIKNQLSLG